MQVSAPLTQWHPSEEVTYRRWFFTAPADCGPQHFLDNAAAFAGVEFRPGDEVHIYAPEWRAEYVSHSGGRLGIVSLKPGETE